MPSQKFVAIGECMLEFSQQAPDSFQLRVAGDSFNVALYLARSVDSSDITVDYMTALGDDPYSQQMLTLFAAEGIGSQYIARLPNRLPGLYLMRNDDQGERTFYYYRSQAAARNMFDRVAGEQLAAALPSFSMVYCSGISLAILPDSGKQCLINALQAARAKGATIVFDTNYRPVLWSGLDEAKQYINQLLVHVDIALPSFNDEQGLFGDQTPEATAQRLHDMGVTEVVVKQGEAGYLLSYPEHQMQVSVTASSNVVDTSAAGDSFNGGYLAAKLKGLSPRQAAEKAHVLANTVIQHRGAIIPQDAMP